MYTVPVHDPLGLSVIITMGTWRCCKQGSHLIQTWRKRQVWSPSFISEWAMPPPALRYCTQPLDSASLLPMESLCVSCPSTM